MSISSIFSLSAFLSLSKKCHSDFLPFYSWNSSVAFLQPFLSFPSSSSTVDIASWGPFLSSPFPSSFFLYTLYKFIFHYQPKLILSFFYPSLYSLPTRTFPLFLLCLTTNVRYFRSFRSLLSLSFSFCLFLLFLYLLFSLFLSLPLSLFVPSLSFYHRDVALKSISSPLRIIIKTTKRFPPNRFKYTNV